MSAWDLVLQEDNNKTEVKFVKTPKGVTKVRLVDLEPKAIWKHWINAANNGKGMSAVCMGEGCPVCQDIKDAKAKGIKSSCSTTRNFAMNCLVKTDDGMEMQILEKGKTVFQQLHTLMSQMGALSGYEVNITRTGDKMQDITYQTLPVYPPQAMTEEEVKFVEENRINLDEYYKVMTKEQLIGLMSGKTLQDVTGSTTQATQTEEVSGGFPDFAVEE